MTNALKGNPLFFDTAGGTSYYPGNGSITSVLFGGNIDTDTTILMYNALNTVHNPNMLHWNDGTSAAPDGWAITGADATVVQEETIIRAPLDTPQPGPYSAKVTRVGENVTFTQSVLKWFDSNDPRSGIAYWKGRYIIGGMWVYATEGTRGYVETYDGQTTTTSSAHGGGTTWTWLPTALVAVHGSADELTIRGTITGGNTSVYFCEALLFEARPIVKMLSTGNAQAISYPERVPFDGLYLAELTSAGTLQVTV